MIDAEQIGSLIEEQSSVLTLYARQWTTEPEEIVQRAFVKLSLRAELPSHPASWLFAVVRNEALQLHRENTRRERREHDHHLQASTIYLESVAETAVDAETICEALAELDLSLREVVIAHVWGQLTFREVGELLSISESTAHRRYRSALDSLRHLLRIPCPNSPPKTT